MQKIFILKSKEGYFHSPEELQKMAKLYTELSGYIFMPLSDDLEIVDISDNNIKLIDVEFPEIPELEAMTETFSTLKFSN